MAGKRHSQAKTRSARTKTAAKPVLPPKSPSARFAIVGMLLFLAIILAFIFLSYPSPVPTPSGEENEGPICINAETKPCQAGPCNGTAICINGVWSGCRWEKACVPGSRTACTHLSCTYGMMECNECGTGYGPCNLPE